MLSRTFETPMCSDWQSQENFEFLEGSVSASIAQENGGNKSLRRDDTTRHVQGILDEIDPLSYSQQNEDAIKTFQNQYG